MKLCVGSLLILVAGTAAAAPVTFSSAGANAAAIQGTLDDYRAALGTQNSNAPANFAGGRREVNWDGVPPAASSPNAFPGDFFNGTTAGRARGIQFSTPGAGFEVSANSGAGPVDFENIDPSYAGLFAAFSPQKLFTPIGSNTTDVTFFSPVNGTTPAFTDGFGAIFSDVDLPTTTSLQYFDLANNSLGTYFVDAAQGNETFSFFGLLFDDGTRIGRVRITTGTAALAPGVLETSTVDLVTIDDFIYGEPQPIPEPSTWLLMSAGFAAFGIMRRRRA